MQHLESSLDARASKFWRQFQVLPASDRLSAFLEFAKVAIAEKDAGRANRRQVGSALAPGWSDHSICATGDMTIATDLACQLRAGVFESEEEIEALWEQMTGILQKYL